VALTAVSAPGCSTWNGGPEYRPRFKPAWKLQTETRFRVGLPGESWRPHHEDETQVAWRSDPAGAIIQARAQCEEHGDSDLASFTDHLRIDTSAWKIVSEEGGRLLGRDSLRTRVHAGLDGVPVHMEIVVVKKSGCLFDVTLLAVPDRFEASLPAFERVVGGLEFPVK
jgi:hypothetical protein